MYDERAYIIRRVRDDGQPYYTADWVFTSSKRPVGDDYNIRIRATRSSAANSHPRLRYYIRHVTRAVGTRTARVQNKYYTKRRTVVANYQLLKSILFINRVAVVCPWGEVISPH